MQILKVIAPVSLQNKFCKYTSQTHWSLCAIVFEPYVMKRLIIVFTFLIFTTILSFGQKPNDIISLRIGYSSTNIVFKEAFEPSFQFFGNTFNSGKTFVGDGPEVGVSKSVNDKLFIDLSISSFSGKDTKTKVNNNENYYTLKGFQIPLTANYLLRDSAKKFRINIGAGLQFLNGHLQQFETITTASGQITNQITDIDISEIQLALRPGVQLRIIPNLFVSFIVKISISTHGRYSDNPCFSVKYTFNKK